MAEEKTIQYRSTKRFGARYGRTIKLNYGKIEQEQRKKHKCPYCGKTAVKRVAVGIWHCNKCDAKFTGKAYSLEKSYRLEEEEMTEKNG